MATDAPGPWWLDALIQLWMLTALAVAIYAHLDARDSHLAEQEKRAQQRRVQEAASVATHVVAHHEASHHRPAPRPERDWTALAVVGGAALAALALVGCAAIPDHPPTKEAP